MSSPPGLPIAPTDYVERVRRRLADTPGTPTPQRVATALRDEGVVLGDTALLDLLDGLQGELVGVGPLGSLLRDPDVSDVVVNGPDRVLRDRGCGLEPVDLRFDDEAALRRLAQRLVSASGRRLDDAAPFADAVLPGGVRLHAVLPPIAAGGTHLSLRVPRRRVFTPEQLVATGSLHPAFVPLLRAVVAARFGGVVTGGTGTGKTTWLSTLLSMVDPSERIVVVEDLPEVAPDHPHVVRLVARSANVEGAGAVELRDLVRQTLRMRPDRIVVGEARGSELVDLLAALNTGHTGGWATIHANKADDVPARLEAMAFAAGLPGPALHAQAAAAFDVVLHLERTRAGLRRVSTLGLLTRGGSGLHVDTAWQLHGEELRAGPAAAALALRLHAGEGLPG